MNARDLRGRIKRLFSFTKGVDSILLVNTSSQDPNLVYMTDFQGGLFEGSFLLIERRGVTLFTSPLEYETAKEQKIDGMRIVNMRDKKDFEKLVAGVKGRRIGFNGRFVPYNTYKSLKKRLRPKKLTDVSEALELTRQVKDNYEITQIRNGCRITKRAIGLVQRQLRVGMTEKEAAYIFESLIGRFGSAAFITIVCFGKNAALPHHAPDDTRLRYGDFVLIDVGTKIGNYCSDVTRTMIFGKDRTRIKDYDRKVRIMNTVNEAQALAIKAIHPGAKGNRIHMIAQNYIDKAYGGIYKDTFIHSLGHSIGVEVHDGSGRFLSPGSKLVLKKGMVSSVEPGIYIPGFGGARTEDDIVVTEKGCTVL
jgi:Xaa-Pro aminopeptidase